MGAEHVLQADSPSASGSSGRRIREPASRLFTFLALAIALASIRAFSFHHEKIFAFVILPFLVISVLYQRVDPILRRPIERGELRTDVLSTMVAAAITAAHGSLVNFGLHALVNGRLHAARAAWSTPTLSALPLWLECGCAFLLYDFMFYVTHRWAHQNPFLWRLHSVHHSPDKMTYMNSNRIHPLDLVIRRFSPSVVLLGLGVSSEALVFVGVVVDVIGPITHLNVRLKHGCFNYLVGTNEVHIWHHSTNAAEAKNYGITMIWDHLFSTFYFPRDREAPERLGLSDAVGYPRHDYWRLLLLPWRWRWRP